MESLCYAQNSDFYFKNIKIPVPYFKRFLQDYFEDGEIIVYEKKLLTGISKVSITPYMEHIFRRVTRLYTLSGWAWVSVSGKQNPRIAVSIFERSVGAAVLSPEYCCISKSERDSIIEAKRIIDSELAFAPSCEELARQSQYQRLKIIKGILHAVRNISVHAYVIEQRLERAAGSAIRK